MRGLEETATAARAATLGLFARYRRTTRRARARLRLAARRTADRKGMRAYNLVVLAVAVTLLNVWIGSTLPLWSHQIKRDKEAELVFRGMQYAEAIRLFQTRYNRLPTSLKELIEVEPRCLRQPWENPMRDDGRWGLVPQGVGGQLGRDATNPNPGGVPGLENDPGAENRDPSSGLPRDPFAEEKGEDAGVLLSQDPDDDFGEPPSGLQIRGVFHPGSEESARFFLGAESYREWLFTAELFATMKPLQDLPAIQVPFSAREIGRNFPPGVVPLVTQPSNQPQQQGQNVGGNAGEGAGGGDTGGLGTPQSPGTNNQGRPIIGGPAPVNPAGGGSDGRNN